MSESDAKWYESSIIMNSNDQTFLKLLAQGSALLTGPLRDALGLLEEYILLSGRPHSFDCDFAHFETVIYDL